MYLKAHFQSDLHHQSEGRIMAPAGDAPVSIVDVRDMAQSPLSL